MIQPFAIFTRLRFGLVFLHTDPQSRRIGEGLDYTLESKD